MSDEAAEKIMESFDRWKQEDQRSRFLNRMKHKLNAKERSHRW